jgi:Transcriptional regulators
MVCIFIQVRCRPGRTYEVADRIYEKEVVSELYSTSGEYDLLAKVYVPEGEDVGKYVNDIFADIEDVDRTLTTLTFKAF